MQNVDEPARHVFGYQFYGVSASITVPSDRRYIVDQYSAECFDLSTAMTDVSINTVAGGTPVVSGSPAAHFVTNLGDGPPHYLYRVSGSGPVYADPGTQILLLANVNYTNCDSFVSGHYVLQP